MANFDIIKEVFHVPNFWTKYEFISDAIDNKSLDWNLAKKIIEKNNMELLISWYLSMTWVTDISFYFRNLANWSTFGFNERALFKPASLTKVPTLIAVLRKNMEQPWFLDKRVEVKIPLINYYLHYPSQKQINNNRVYSVRDLTDYMIKYSDNNATLVLWNLLSGGAYRDIYKELNINFSWDNVEVVDYSYLFEILYNSLFLNKSDSEMALSLLSQTQFNDWIKKYIPRDIKVAHKFGEFNIDNVTKQLHDCWIVYYPNHPYVLCIMTRWYNYDDLETVIWSLSKVIFQRVQESYK